MAQYQGVVSWFNNDKGYGFLARDGGSDVFCHFSSIQSNGYKTLKEGDPVTFDIIQGDKGPQADNVISKGMMAVASLPVRQTAVSMSAEEA